MNRLAAAAALVLSAQLSLVAYSQGGAATAATAAENGTVGLSSATFTGSQSSGLITITAVRTGATKGALSVNFKEVAGTALAGTNYTPETGKLSWANGDGAKKTFQIPVNAKNTFSGTKWFRVEITAGANTVLGSHTNATVNITGGSSGTTTTTAPPTTTIKTPSTVKSIKSWGVSCNEGTDETNQLAAALAAAADGAFTLQIDCPVRFHTGSMINHTINVGSDVNVKFTGSGELLTVSGGATALNISSPKNVTFVDWNLTYL